MGALKRRTTSSLLVLAVLAAIGCGGSSGGEGSDPAMEVTSPKEPTRQFYVPGEDNSVQLFGNEATPAVRNRVSGVMQAWMRARAAVNWKEDCRHLTRETVDYATNGASTLGQRKVRDCDEALAIIAVKG